MTEEKEIELREQAKNGREAELALKFLDVFLIQERAFAIQEIETSDNLMYETLLAQKIFLSIMRKFENMLKSFIDLGEIAEKELNENA